MTKTLTSQSWYHNDVSTWVIDPRVCGNSKNIKRKINPIKRNLSEIMRYFRFTKQNPSIPGCIIINAWISETKIITITSLSIRTVARQWMCPNVEQSQSLDFKQNLSIHSFSFSPSFFIRLFSSFNRWIDQSNFRHCGFDFQLQQTSQPWM